MLNVRRYWRKEGAPGQVGQHPSGVHSAWCSLLGMRIFGNVDIFI